MFVFVATFDVVNGITSSFSRYTLGKVKFDGVAFYLCPPGHVSMGMFTTMSGR